MSCHDIGRGMNDIVRLVISLYDNEQVSKDPAKRIIAACGRAVNWCDGNDYEAWDYIRRCRCGKCLKMIPEGQELFSIWDLPRDFFSDHPRIMEEKKLACDSLCGDCFDEVMSDYYDDENSAEKLKRKIREYYKEEKEEYQSAGSYPNSNNGCRWPDSTE